MGGYGSGGTNKKKPCINQFNRIDSYSVSEGDYSDYTVCKIKTGASERRFFKCPLCRRMVRYLYQSQYNTYICRHCIGGNYQLQQMGSCDIAIERAKDILQKLQVDVSDMTPWDFMQLHSIDKPDNMDSDEYVNLIRKLWKQQDIWLDCAMKIIRKG